MDATSKQLLTTDSTGISAGFTARLSQKAAIAELGQRALLSPDVDGLLQLAVGLLREVLGVEYVKVLRQPAAGKPLVFIAASGWHDDVRVGETTVPCDLDSLVGYTLLSNEPVFVKDMERDTRFEAPSVLLDHGVASPWVLSSSQSPFA